MGWFLADAVPGGGALAAFGCAALVVAASGLREPPSMPAARATAPVTCRIEPARPAPSSHVYLDLHARGDALVRRAHEVAALTIAEHPELQLHDAPGRGPTGRWLSIELEPFRLLGARLDCAAVVVSSVGSREVRYRRGARITLDQRADARAHAAARDACITTAVEAATEAAVTGP